MFRRKVESVEAVQWHPGVDIAGVEDTDGDLPYLARSAMNVSNGVTQVHYNPPQFLHDGDWVITFPTGDKTVAKDEIFKALYEPQE